MVKYSIIFLSILLSHSTFAQSYHAQFVYPEMDQTVISLWMSEDEHALDKESSVQNIADKWTTIREDIATSNIAHFDKMGFIEDQDIRIASMHKLMAQSKYTKAREEAYVLLSQFREVRQCFTQDDYILDYILDAFDGYIEVHKIIHDEMMGLYEWREFVWFVDKLKISVADLETHLTLSRVEPYHNTLIPSIDKLKGCLNTLDESLGDAYRPDFELPCNELGTSFKELIRAYNHQNEL